jgi:ferredoxin-NADP reductase
VLDALTATADGELTVLGPFGRLYHRPAERPILMAATGAGLGPLLAILSEMRSTAGPPPVRLYYGSRPGAVPNPGNLAALAEDLAHFEFTPVDLPADGPLRLRLAPLVRRISHDLRDASGHDAYVAGPVALCDAVESLLTAKGLPERRFFAERFY